MSGGSYLSGGVISFLLEISRLENVPKTAARKRRCCETFLSLFEDFNLEKFAVELEKIVEEHLRIAKDASESTSRRTQELAYATGLKSGTANILDWFFSAELLKCQKFVAEGDKVINEVLKSVDRLGIDESSSLDSTPRIALSAPKRTRKPRKVPQARVPVRAVAEDINEINIEEVTDDEPEVPLGEPEIEEPPPFDLMTSVIAEEPMSDPHPTMPFEGSDMDFEEQGVHTEMNGVESPGFELEPLVEAETRVKRRTPSRRKRKDDTTKLSDEVLERNMAGRSDFCEKVQANREKIFGLCSRHQSAQELLRPGPNLPRGPKMSEILTNWFKRPRLVRNPETHLIEGPPGTHFEDDGGGILGHVNLTDDLDGFPDMDPMDFGEGGSPPVQAVPDGDDREAPAVNPEESFHPGKDFDDQLREVRALISRSANRFHQQGNIRLRYACLDEIARGVPRREFPALFKCILILCELEQLYIKQPSQTSNQIFVFPRGQARDTED